MQTVGNPRLSESSRALFEAQTEEINRRFSHLETFLKQSFGQILGTLAAQKSQINLMASDLDSFKRDSLTMGEQIKSLLFSRKSTALAGQANQPQLGVEIEQQPLPHSNDFQLTGAKHQIKFSAKGGFNQPRVRSNNFLEESLRSESKSKSETARLKVEFQRGLQIGSGVSPKDDPLFGVEGPSSNRVDKGLLLRFETPQGKKEALQKKMDQKLMNPPKLKKRSSLISKQSSRVGRPNKKMNKKSLRKRKKRIMRKANLNLLADKLGQLEFDGEDLQSRGSVSVHDRSHFLDRVSRDQSVSSFNRFGPNVASKKSSTPPSLGIFNPPQIRTLGDSSQKQTFAEKNREQSEIFHQPSGQNQSLSDLSNKGSINIPSLHLESSYIKSSKQKNLDYKEAEMNSHRTIHFQTRRSSKIVSLEDEQRKEMQTPNMAARGDISVFSINRKQANLSSNNLIRAVPVLPVLQSSTKKEEPEYPSRKVMPFPQEETSIRETKPGGNPMINNRVIDYDTFGANQFVIRDPLLGEKTPSSINHSNLRKNLNAIQFDFSYHTGNETRESIPDFVHFESQNVSEMQASKFEMTPLQFRNQQAKATGPADQGARQRNWSIHPNPKGAYLEKVRSNFPQIKKGLKINQYGQMSIDDSTFSIQMKMPEEQIHTVRSSNGKFEVNEVADLDMLNIEAGGCYQQQKLKEMDSPHEDLDNKSVKTTNQLSSKKKLPEFDFSENYDTSMFSADFDSKDSHLTRKQNEGDEPEGVGFNLQRELRNLPKYDFFGEDFQVPGIKNQVNDSQFNMSLLEQLDFKEDLPKEGAFAVEPGREFQRPRELFVEEMANQDLILENEGFEETLRELKTQLDAAHYQMFDSKFEAKFLELTRKLREYWVLNRDLETIRGILGGGPAVDRGRLGRILAKRGVRADAAEVGWNEGLQKTFESMQTESFEESLRKLMRDPSGFNSFLILVKRRLSEQETLFQNSF